MRATAVLSLSARHVLGEVVRFLLVGGLATVVSFVGFNSLVHGLFLSSAPLHAEPVVAYVVVNLAGGLVAYTGMSLWAFRDRGSHDPATGLLRFFGLGALTMLIPVLFLWFSRYVLGLHSALADNLAANVIGLGVGTATRFWVFRRFVFEKDGDQPGHPLAGEGHA